MGVVAVKRFDVFLINLDPTVGTEIKKVRPCLVISPNSMNKYLSTVIIAPMTTRIRSYPSRVRCHFDGKNGEIVLDQLRAVDKRRLVRKLGRLDQSTSIAVVEKLLEMFAE